MASLVDVLGRPAYIRVLVFLRQRGPSRFTDIQKSLDLNPKTVDAALKGLRRGLWVIPVTREDEPGGPIMVQYELSKRGQALLELLDGMHAAARQRQRTLGSEAVKDLEALFA